MERLKEKSVIERLTTGDYDEGIEIVPSYLHYAEQEGKYEELIQNWNHFVRAIQSKYRDIPLIQDIGYSVNSTFAHLDKFVPGLQQGGSVPNYIFNDTVQLVGDL